VAVVDAGPAAAAEVDGDAAAVAVVDCDGDEERLCSAPVLELPHPAIAADAISAASLRFTLA
jgi:hypothetical protein